jgi:hypothetical protein
MLSVKKQIRLHNSAIIKPHDTSTVVDIVIEMVSQIVVHDPPGGCSVLENDLKYSCIYTQLRKSVRFIM